LWIDRHRFANEKTCDPRIAGSSHGDTLPNGPYFSSSLRENKEFRQDFRRRRRLIRRESLLEFGPRKLCGPWREIPFQ
jgi:hypothetical protein